MSVFNRDLVVQLLNKILGKADLAIGKTDEVLGDTKKILSAVSGGTGAVKSVQRGLCNLSDAREAEKTNYGTIYESTISISTINPQKSIALVSGTTNWTDDRGAILRKLTSNQIVIGTKKVGSTGSPKAISWQVIEFY